MPCVAPTDRPAWIEPEGAGRVGARFCFAIDQAGDNGLRRIEGQQATGKARLRQLPILRLQLRRRDGRLPQKVDGVEIR
ncbi:MAG: hypothetical protein ACOYNY_40315 [Caldilineaceae bacterium]